MAGPADQADRAVHRRLSSDTIARIVAIKMGERLGQQIVVENRVGGSTIIGTDAVAKAAPDGYTLGLANTTTHAASAALTPNLPFDPVKDFAPVAMIGSSPFVLVGAPQVAAPTLKDFVALAKAKPGALSYASAGTGTLAHLAGELFKRKAGIDVTHVPYRGSAQSMLDLMQGRIELSVSTIPPTLAAHPRGQAARARHHERAAQRHAAGGADRGRGRRARLRGRRCGPRSWCRPACRPTSCSASTQAVLAVVASAGRAAGADDPGRRSRARPAGGGRRAHPGRHREVARRGGRDKDNRRAVGRLMQRGASHARRGQEPGAFRSPISLGPSAKRARRFINRGQRLILRPT